MAADLPIVKQVLHKAVHLPCLLLVFAALACSDVADAENTCNAYSPTAFVSVAPDGRHFVRRASRTLLEFRSADTLEVERTLPVSRSLAHAVDFRRGLAAVWGPEGVQLLSLTDGAVRYSLKDPEYTKLVDTMEFYPEQDSLSLVSIPSPGIASSISPYSFRVAKWDWTRNKVTDLARDWQSIAVYRVRFLNDGRYLAALFVADVGEPSSFIVWDFKAAKQIKLQRLTGVFVDFLPVPGSRKVLLVHATGVYEWDPFSTDAPVPVLQSAVCTAAVSPEGNLIATLNGRDVSVWNRSKKVTIVTHSVDPTWQGPREAVFLDPRNLLTVHRRIETSKSLEYLLFTRWSLPGLEIRAQKELERSFPQ